MTCRRFIFAHYIISGRNRAFDSLVGFVQLVSGSGRESLPASNSARENAKIFSQLMSKSRSLAKISERRLQPLLV